MTDAAARDRRRVLDLFDRALDLPPDRRRDWLLRHHGDDPATVAAVSALLAADAAPTVFPASIDAAIDLVAPARVGSYRLVRRIGRGGMGEVWHAERDDGLFDHHVAVKLMRPALLSPDLEPFFDSERRILARMRHPHIARLFDGGITDEGIPWFAMDLVDGVPLDEWTAARGPLSPARDEIAVRVRLAIRICDAVQHAHQQLIVHADIKPQNILIEGEGEPRLVDFGIAQLAAAGEAAEPRAYPRTTTYASPERIAGAMPSVADDIFALGMVLRGLLSDQWHPGDASVAAPSERAPAARTRVLRGDLDAIVARAAAADRVRRYATVDALAADMRAWLTHRPVAARDGGWRYRAARFVQRHPWAVSAGSLALIAMIATSIVVTSLYVRAERAHRDAEQRFADVRSLAGYMLIDFHDALEPLAGASALRARTAEIGRRYLERLAHLPAADIDLQRDVAIGYGRVGHTLAVTATNGATGVEAGDRALARAEAILAPLVRSAPGRDDLKIELARVLTWRSSVIGYARSDLPRAHALIDRALTLDDAVLRRDPRNIDAAYGRWLAVIGRLDLWSTQERWADIARLAAGQLTGTRALPVPARYRDLRPLLEAAVDNAWGDALDYQGQVRPAITRYHRAYATLERALARASADVRVRTRMIGYAYQLSTAYEEAGDHRAALDWAERGLEGANELQHFDRSPTVLGMANLVTLQHATLLVQDGRREAAIAEALASVEQRRRYADAEPTSDDARSSYLFALRPLSEIFDLAGKPDQACVVARQAAAGWVDLYQNRTAPARQDGDIKRLARRLASCRSTMIKRPLRS